MSTVIYYSYHKHCPLAIWHVLSWSVIVFCVVQIGHWAIGCCWLNSWVNLSPRLPFVGMKRLRSESELLLPSWRITSWRVQKQSVLPRVTFAFLHLMSITALDMPAVCFTPWSAKNLSLSIVLAFCRKVSASYSSCWTFAKEYSVRTGNRFTLSTLVLINMSQDGPKTQCWASQICLALVTLVCTLAKSSVNIQSLMLLDVKSIP